MIIAEPLKKVCKEVHRTVTQSYSPDTLKRYSVGCIDQHYHRQIQVLKDAKKRLEAYLETQPKTQEERLRFAIFEPVEEAVERKKLTEQAQIDIWLIGNLIRRMELRNQFYPNSSGSSVKMYGFEKIV